MAAKRSMVLTAGSHLMINEERAEKGEFKYHVRRCVQKHLKSHPTLNKLIVASHLLHLQKQYSHQIDER
jgi:hypothetical protein